MSKTNVHKTVSEMQKTAKSLLGEIKKTKYKTRDSISLFKDLKVDIKRREALSREIAKQEALEAAAKVEEDAIVNDNLPEEPKVTIEKELIVDEVVVKPKEGSKEFIKEWLPNTKIENYIVSAIIEAKKP